MNAISRSQQPVAPTLVFAWGNPGRGDDALGPRFAETVEAWHLPGVDCLTDFQLQVEHALDLAGRTRILFVDAAIEGPAPFSLDPIAAAADRSLNSHAMSPQALLHVLRQFDPTCAPQAWLLGIRGDRWAFGDDLHEAALANLDAALSWARAWLLAPLHDQAAA